MIEVRIALAALIITTAGLGCADTPADYDPTWDNESVVAGGKADGLFDSVPTIEIGSSASGDVGGNRLELYRLELERTDRIEVTMTVTSGNLDPHLQLYYGTSTYIRSEDWSRSGNTLTKEYLAGDAGTYLLAARAYRERGDGDYEISVRCIDGPCAGNFPVPDTELAAGDVSWCIGEARACSFSRLDRYGGAVGEARASLLWQECLGEARLVDGTSCSAACDWVNPDDVDDGAATLCNDITASLIFYADQDSACLDVLDECLVDCHDGGEDGLELYYSAESLCWMNGFNGNCDSYARGHSACGGGLPADSAAQCTALCHATIGAFYDDLDTLCSSDSDCEDYCDVDIDAAAAACGGLSESNRRCIADSLYDGDAYICTLDALDFALLGVAPAVTCSYSMTSPAGSTSADLLGASTSSEVHTSSRSYAFEGTLLEHQFLRALIALEQIDEGDDLYTGFLSIDDNTFTHHRIDVGGTTYDWIKAYAGDTEIGAVFLSGTLQLVGLIGDGDVRGCSLL